jgi:hypothetical protein
LFETGETRSQRNKEVPLTHTWLARLSGPLLCFVILLALLSSCSNASTTSAPPAPPPVWKNYQGNAFTMSYFSNWSTATKDFYLGTRYPPLEMLQGEIFTRNGAFLQVAYAMKTNKQASAQDIMLKFLLNPSTQPAAKSSLSTTTLDKATWYQGTVTKQVKQRNGTVLAVEETALGIDRKTGPKSDGIYLIFYQDNASSYPQNTRDFFERMVNSFQFAP